MDTKYLDMLDQETVQELLVEGCTFVFLGVPQDTQFGIDLNSWNTDEDFRGIKMIPPGLHYIHYAPVSKTTGDIAPRSGFLHYFKSKEFVVKMWDKKSEDMSKDEISEESIQRLKDNLFNLDRHLAPYPYENWRKWQMLSSQISESLAKKLSPENVIIRSSIELLSTTDKDRPRGVKNTTEEDKSETASTSKDDDSTPIDETGSDQSEPKKPKLRLSFEEKEEAMLPFLKPVPGSALRFTEIPRDKYPEGSTPQEITKHYLDQSYTLELVVAQHEEPLHVIGEMQFAYLCFLIGHSVDALEYWKNLVVLLCSCDEAMHKYRGVFFHFVRTIEVHIEEMPEEFLADIVMNRNLIYKKLKEFFRTAYITKLDGRLKTMIERLKDSLTESLQWDFSDLEDDEEDEKPVIVNLDEKCLETENV